MPFTQGSNPFAIGLSAPLASPVVTSITNATTGGALPANTTYYYKIVAIDALGGLSLPSNEVSITTGATNTNAITIDWTAVPGCVGIRVYRGTSSNGQSVYFTTGGSFNSLTRFINLNVSGGIAGTPPITTTGYAYLVNTNNFITPSLYAPSTGGLYAEGLGGTTVLNSRGIKSVDLQFERSLPTQVVAGSYSAIIGGTNNTVSSNSQNSGCFVGLGNSVSGNAYAATIAGYGNTASANYSTVINGDQNLASGTYSCVFGGSYGTASAIYSKTFGAYALANLYGQSVFASGRNSTQGDAQDSKITSRNITTNTATPTELLLDGNGGTNYFTIANNSTQPFIILASARGSAGTNIAKSAAWKIEGVVINNGGVITVPTHTITDFIKEVATWNISISVVGTRLAITATGDAGSTIKWFASIWHIMNLG